VQNSEERSRGFEGVVVGQNVLSKAGVFLKLAFQRKAISTSVPSGNQTILVA
jgi:hypothetical protein